MHFLVSELTLPVLTQSEWVASINKRPVKLKHSHQHPAGLCMDPGQPKEDGGSAKIAYHLLRCQKVTQTTLKEAAGL